MSDAFPPPTPPSVPPPPDPSTPSAPPTAAPTAWSPPPPPPLPPAPAHYPPAPVIGWGIGDIFYGLLVYLVGGVLSAVVLALTGAIDVGSAGLEDTQLGVGAIALSLAAGWLGFVGWPFVATMRKGQRSLARDFGLSIQWIDVAWGVGGGVVALVVASLGNVAWVVISGEDAPDNAGFLPKHPGVLGGLALFVLVAVLTPIAEELFFRGLALRAIGRRWSLPVGVVASSLLFGSLHFSGSTIPHGLFIVGVTASYGVVFALLVVRAGGRLGPSIVAHACVNGVAVIAMFLGAAT